MRCVTLCSPGGSDCPDGFSCLAAGGSGACWPGEDAINPPEDGGGTCGCRAGGRSSTPLFGFLLGFAVFGLALRRRRR
jgi:MYXO-CTERM domain-containing protein